MNYFAQSIKSFTSITHKPELAVFIKKWLESDNRNTGLMPVLNACRKFGIEKETAIKAVESAYCEFDKAVGADENKINSHPVEIRRAAEKVYGEHFAISENRPHLASSRVSHLKPEVVFDCLLHWGETNFLHEDTALMRKFNQWCQDVVTTSRRLDPEHASENYNAHNCAKGMMAELFSADDNVVCGSCNSQPMALGQALERISDDLPEFTSTCTYGENRSDVKSIRYILLEWDCQLDGSKMPEDWMTNGNIEKCSMSVTDISVTLPKDTAVLSFSFLAKFCKMGIPVKAVTWSGNKSLHFLIPTESVQITERNSEDIKKIIRALRLVIQWLGCDTSCISWGRLTRLPFGVRLDSEGNSVFQLSALYDEVLPISLEGLLKRMSELAKEIKSSGETVVFQEKTYITVDELDRWLAYHDKSIATNMLTGKNEYVGWPLDFDQGNNIFQTIRDELRVVGQKICPELIKSLVSSVGSRHAFHPVRDYLESLTWDGKDRIPMILDALGIASESLEATMVSKWMLQAVASAYNDKKHSFEHVLVLVGPQGCGKTTFFRMLVPSDYRAEWFREGRSINMEDKDSVRIATSGWITELGEADSTLQREQAALKAFLSSPNDTYRTPFAVKPITRARWTVFGATVNTDIYLNDQTGNRRWWTIKVDHMDVAKVRALGEHIDQIWAQFKSMWDDAAREGKEWSCFRLTDEESSELEALNAAHTSIDPLLMLINESFNWDAHQEAWSDKTSTEICERLHVSGSQKRKFLNTLREEARRRGIVARRPGNRETWYLPPFVQGLARNYWL